MGLNVSRSTMQGLTLACLPLCIVFIWGAGPAFAAGSPHSLDPKLSLTGSCGASTKTKVDPVEDPGCPGGEHPPKGFTSVRSITTDFYGDIYVASYGTEAANGAEGRIDVFSPEGIFITELLEPEGPKDLAVDSDGNLYVFSHHSGVGHGELVRYAPSVYKPLEGNIEYGGSAIPVAQGGVFNSIVVTPSNDHLFLKGGSFIAEYSSATEGNKLLDESIGVGELNSSDGLGLAVDEVHSRIYASNKHTVKIFKLESPHNLLDTIEGTDVPAGELSGSISLAADEATGKFFLFEGDAKKRIYEFEFDEASKGATYLSTLEIEGQDGEFPPILGSEIGVDNGPFSPNSGFKLAAKAGYVFIPSEESKIGQSLAFAPRVGGPPEIDSVSVADVTTGDAELRATINPDGVETKYTFEYTTQESFEVEGFADGSVAGEGQIPAGLAGVPVSASASGLEPETEYRFRVVATNGEGADEAEGSFATYPEEEVIPPCVNDATRTGLSALLPDCRAYEIVTPPDTNARAPRGIGKSIGVYFPTREASPAGERVSFITEGGAIPGQEGTGSLSGDAYLSTRSATGWSSASAGPNGVEAVSPAGGSTSPDQGYSFWSTNGPGNASIEGESTSYVRYPDGHSDLVGRGSLKDDPQAVGELISENGSHIVLASVNAGSHKAVQLEPNAPPNGTGTVYDRTTDAEGNEETHVVSLLPGSVTPSVGQDALYQGASLDGKGVAFTIGKQLYLRFNNEETFEIGENVAFAGVAEGGARIFYLKGGDLFAFDAKAEETIQFTESGDVTPVNVAADGTAAYFVSPSVLTGGEENPNGATAKPGEENLYLSREGAISFVGTVTERDVEGEFGATEQMDGLGLWIEAVGRSGGAAGRLGIDPSRTTPDGGVLLFESRATLDRYDPGGHAEIYLFDSVGDSLQCLSCSPTQTPATGGASLESILQAQFGPEPFNSFAFVENLRADGRRVFFQSTEALVPGDTDELQDVYEWEAQGVGSCERPGGCIYLISSGHSDRIDYLYAVSDSGDDVFFRSSDLLLGSDTDTTPSIYDARVGGGFPEPAEESCLGEGCRPDITPAPPLSHSKSEAQGPVVEPKQCPKGKRKVVKNGKVRCVKKHHKRNHHRAGSKRKGAGK